ncbi:uridine kinase [Parabacteroides sp. PF5-5]|uniref:nucleoside kinase n=1 Tax=unclassified Parabacteroides TaxID=2649774 RepID=UPI00247510A6|nr:MULTISPECIES: nucleoside kinase [unclassified Parabacteroides]MDH6305948.1 uridine kinase [Parabacteroides sp. PH5-39]MDH6317204.1 uridine kinase [Parabacteroides sp. PF5-13]MDH6320660.1 uridine kinase [Parabacteroides sp. PH5-13]MDH6324419.1 uridine kinase [Parabacteroides sp. PH5-8]MDH6328389.1 uridine kinase [Parabacteroides sp. PH5-41]
MSATITIYCKNNSQYKEIPVGSSLLEIYQSFGSPLDYPPMNALVNNKVEGLNYRCWQPKDMEFMDYTNQSGMRTYVRSLCHIFSKAVNDILPTATLNLEHPISKGYYCVIHNGKSIDEETIGKIKRRMQTIIDEDIPFHHKSVRTSDAAILFRERGMEDKARLIETAGMAYTSYYELDGYINFFYGCLTPSSGYIHLFDIVPYFDGVLLRVPQRNNPAELEPVIKQDQMFGAYKEHLTLQRTLNLSNVGDLNKAVADGFTSEIVMVSEAMQEKQIAKIAEQIANRYDEGVRIVLISGPSSSGKTTFSKRLEIQLITHLFHPVSISLDDYFLNRVDTPRDEKGDYDFESLYALDLPYFNSDMQKLLSGEEIDLPTYSFTTGTRIYKGKKLKLKKNSLLIIEGIHALNPELTAHIESKYKYRVYVSALTSISLDNHNWIPTTDNRLLRRIIRDYRFRGYSAKDTISRWASVRKGEDKWIFPYQEEADAMFNSAMLYELAALRRYAEPILSEVKEYDKENAEAYRLMRFLKYFTPITDQALPGTSLLREFLGGGSFHY